MTSPATCRASAQDVALRLTHDLQGRHRGADVGGGGDLVVTFGELPYYRGWFGERTLSIDPPFRVPEFLNTGAYPGTGILFWLGFAEPSKIRMMGL